MMSSAIQFFSNDLTDNILIKWLSTFCKVFFKDLIDHSLITVTRLISSFTEFFKDVRIKIYSNSGFSFSWNNLASSGIFKIIFLFHIVSSLMMSLFEQILNEWYRHDMCRQVQLPDRMNQNQGLQNAVRSQRSVLLMSWQMDHKAPFLHRKSGFYAF